MAVRRTCWFFPWSRWPRLLPLVSVARSVRSPSPKSFVKRKSGKVAVVIAASARSINSRTRSLRAPCARPHQQVGDAAGAAIPPVRPSVRPSVVSAAADPSTQAGAVPEPTDGIAAGAAITDLTPTNARSVPPSLPPSSAAFPLVVNQPRPDHLNYVRSTSSFERRRRHRARAHMEEEDVVVYGIDVSLKLSALFLLLPPHLDSPAPSLTLWPRRRVLAAHERQSWARRLFHAKSPSEGRKEGRKGFEGPTGRGERAREAARLLRGKPRLNQFRRPKSRREGGNSLGSLVPASSTFVGFNLAPGFIPYHTEVRTLPTARQLPGVESEDHTFKQLLCHQLCRLNRLIECGSIVVI